MTNNLIPITGNTLAPAVRVFFSGRGKCSEGDNYSSFNACHYTGDNPQHVEQCRQQLCDAYGITHDRLIIPRQTHSLNIAIVNEIPFHESGLGNVDAVITTMQDVIVAVNTADCLPILLADHLAGVIAAVHSGWRGTVGRIAAHTVERMTSLGANPLNIKAFIGPSICPDCFEVGDEVVDVFRDTFATSPEIIIKRTSRCHIDLRKACEITLTEAGVPPENITQSGICSHCEPGNYFSARRMGINSGRTLSGIILSKSIKTH